MRAEEFTEAIARLPATGFTGRDFVHNDPYDLYQGRLKKLPGGSGYMYSANNRDISIYDKDRRIGRLSLYQMNKFPLQPAAISTTIAVDKNYRGKGIAKALYGLAMLPKPTGLGLIIIADSIQTPGGRKNWVSLNSIPGVEVSGYISINPDFFAGTKDPFDTKKQYQKRQNEANSFIDKLMSAGALYIGDRTDYDGNHVFQYPITSDESNTELMSAINDVAFEVYGHGLAPGKYWTGLMARYVG